MIDKLATWTELDALIVAIRDKAQRILDEKDASSAEHLEQVVYLLSRAGRVAKRFRAWGSPRPGDLPSFVNGNISTPSEAGSFGRVQGREEYAMPESRLHDRLERQAHEAQDLERRRVK